MASKREQIIDLINEYIYTNGRQRITAIQLNEILMLIANSFELVGQGIGGGISQVLDTDPNVENNQKIINKNGGRFELSGELEIDKEVSFPYIGFVTVKDEISDTSSGLAPDETPKVGGIISSEIATIIGNIDGLNPFESDNVSNLLYNIQNQEVKELGSEVRNASVTETGVLSLYLPNFFPIGKSGIERGVYSGLLQDHIQNIIEIREDKIGITAHYHYSEDRYNDKRNSSIDVRHDFIQHKTSNTSGYSNEIQDPSRKKFEFDGQTTLEITKEGLTVQNGKRLTYYTDSSSGTAGIAVLTSGSVLVSTTAIRANSYVLLTVQDSGEFQGNIRVSEKTAGSGFRISSTNNTDNCQVLWQIIDIN